MPNLTTRIRTILNIQADESRMAALVVGVMLLTSAGFTLGSTGVETLFFTRYGVEYLPYMYIPLGVLTFLTSLGVTALLGRIRHETLYFIIPIGVAALTVFAWLILFSSWNVIYPILWLGKEVINSLVSLVVWGIAGTVCDTRQSKRLFPLFNAGRILGAVIGGMGTGLLVNQIGTQNLLLVWTGMLLLAFALIRILLNEQIPNTTNRPSRRKQKQLTLLQEMQQGYRFVLKSPLMRYISIAAILFSVLYRCIDFPFSKAVAEQFSTDENSLAGFLGLFNGITTASAFLASVFIANRLYVRFGIMNAILAFPIIYLIGFGGIAITNAFAVILAFRFIQMLWLSGIADSAYQAMLNAVPSARRGQVRAFIGGVPEQAGTFLAGLATIVFALQQLAFVGLVAAILTTIVIWRARHAYNLALVYSLRKGRPNLFDQNSRPDAAAIHAALEGMQHPDPIVRRISIEVVSAHSSATDTLVHALSDEDTDVRISALKGLARLQASSALLDIASLLSAPEPELRAQAVDSLRALTPYTLGLHSLLTKTLDDENVSVRVRAIVALLSIDPSHSSRTILRKLSMIGTEEQRVLALNALAEAGDPSALILFSNELEDIHASIPVRCAAASALASCGITAIPKLEKFLSTEHTALRSRIALALGKIGEASLPGALRSLDDPASEEGALLALEQLPARKEAEHLRRYIKRKVESSLRFEHLRMIIHTTDNERIKLLSDSLQSCANRDGIFALKALSLLGDRETITVAVENLQGRDALQRANALETLESIRERALIRPLFQIWEPAQKPHPAINVHDVIVELTKENDEWIRACALFSEDKTMEISNTIPNMERILLLRRVQLFADLSPIDLQRVAAIAREEDFTDGEIICEQGESGNEMYVIVSGEVKIFVNLENGTQKEIARRSARDVVGEMAILSGETRMASVSADGDVLALSLDRLSFESLLRERPEVSLAVVRELCHRLKQLTP